MPTRRTLNDLKNLSTAQTYKVEAKGKDRQEVNFFAKFVLCSNNELFPVIIDTGETRYWVRKIMTLESDDTNFLAEVESANSSFPVLLAAKGTGLALKRSRMWFQSYAYSYGGIWNTSCNATVTIREINLVELLRNIMECQKVDKVSFIPQACCHCFPLMV